MDAASQFTLRFSTAVFLGGVYLRRRARAGSCSGRLQPGRIRGLWRTGAALKRAATTAPDVRLEESIPKTHRARLHQNGAQISLQGPSFQRLARCRSRAGTPSRLVQSVIYRFYVPHKSLKPLEWGQSMPILRQNHSCVSTTHGSGALRRPYSIPCASYARVFRSREPNRQFSTTGSRTA